MSPPPPKESTIKEFARIDSDGSGGISVEELAAAVREREWPISEDELQAMVPL